MDLAQALQWFSFDNIPVKSKITSTYDDLIEEYEGNAEKTKLTKEAYSIIIDLTQNQVTNTADKIISVIYSNNGTKVYGSHVMRLN